jgi:hypothetical protein
MNSALDDAALPAPGFPIRRSAGQRLFSASPRLIAAVHVLLRLLVPRHPPCALDILTVRTAWAPKRSGRYYPYWPCAVFKVRRGARRRTSAVRSLKTEQRRGRLSGRRARSTSGLLPRKEVIQPQLPLRLPCYDFTPITSPTFDGSLPCGLGHRLRVLPAFVV